MKRFLTILLCLLLLPAGRTSAQSQGGAYDIFQPISRYLGQGDADKLSAWFADNLEITVVSSTNDASKNQARQILKSFFDSYSPQGFSIRQKTGNGRMRLAVGKLSAGGENFTVTILVSSKEHGYLIQQLKIEKR